MNTYKLRQWLSLGESAHFLTEKLKSPFQPLDVCRLALDGHLQMSLNFPSGITVRKVRIIKCTLDSLMELVENYTEENRGLYLGPTFELNRIIDYAEPYDTELIDFSGVCDLAMLGDDRYQVEIAFCQYSQLPLPLRSPYTLRGLLLDAGDGELYQVQRYVECELEIHALKCEAAELGISDEDIQSYIDIFAAMRYMMARGEFGYRRYVPSVSLPPDAYFVVRVEALDYLVDCVLNKEPSRKTDPREYNGLRKAYRNIILLNYGEEVARNPRRHYDGKCGKVRTALEMNGLDCPNGQTVERWFKDLD